MFLAYASGFEFHELRASVPPCVIKAHPMSLANASGFEFHELRASVPPCVIRAHPMSLAYASGFEFHELRASVSKKEAIWRPSLSLPVSIGRRVNVPRLRVLKLRFLGV